MPKRDADKPLDYDNWDAPDEPVKPGVFEKADEATIKARNIIIARRKSGQPVAQSKRGLFKTLDVFGSPQATTSPTSFIASSKSEPRDDAYLSKLAVLNKEVSAWISKHVAEDPYCILTPIFDDYAKHLASIGSSTGEAISGKQATQPAAALASTSATMEGPAAPEAKAPSLQPMSSTATTTTNGFGFKFQTTSPTEPAAPKPPLFSFGLASSISSNNPSSNPQMLAFTSAPVKQAEDSISSTTTCVTGADQGM